MKAQCLLWVIFVNGIVLLWVFTLPSRPPLLFDQTRNHETTAKGGAGEAAGRHDGRDLRDADAQLERRVRGVVPSLLPVDACIGTRESLVSHLGIAFASTSP